MYQNYSKNVPICKNIPAIFFSSTSARERFYTEKGRQLWNNLLQVGMIIVTTNRDQAVLNKYSNVNYWSFRFNLCVFCIKLEGYVRRTP